MAAIYVRWIQAGKMRLEDVPALWRAQVEAALPPANSEEGYAVDGALAHEAGAANSPEEAHEHEGE